MSEQGSRFHAGVAAVLSFIFTGLGQLYNGQITKGLVIILLSVVSITVLVMGSIVMVFWLLGKFSSLFALGVGISLCILGIVSACLLGIYSIVDAYRTAARR